jgi:hypothetical protein
MFVMLDEIIGKSFIEIFQQKTQNRSLNSYFVLVLKLSPLVGPEIRLPGEVFL